MIQTPTEYKQNLLRDIRLMEKEIISYAHSVARLKRDGQGSAGLSLKIDLMTDEMHRKTVTLLQY